MRILVTTPKKGETGKIFESFYTEDVIEKLNALGEVEYNEGDERFTKEELMERIADKDVIFSGWDTHKLDKDVLDAAKNLKIIAHTGGTVALVDSAAFERGITVLSGNSIYAESVAESVIAYALAALRKIPDYLTETKMGRWNENINIWEGILDQKVGIVGFGMTARHLVKMLKVFRCEIYVNSLHITDEELKEYNMKRSSLEEIFSECKIVSLHSAMNSENKHMIDRRLLEMLREDALLINTARGGLIDEAAMVELLKEGRFRAILDVFENEPLEPDNSLRDMQGVYVIPHRAGPTYDRRKYVTLGLIEDVKSSMCGKPLKLEISPKYASYMTKE